MIRIFFYTYSVLQSAVRTVFVRLYTQTEPLNRCIKTIRLFSVHEPALLSRPPHHKSNLRAPRYMDHMMGCNRVQAIILMAKSIARQTTINSHLIVSRNSRGIKPTSCQCNRFSSASCAVVARSRISSTFTLDARVRDRCKNKFSRFLVLILRRVESASLRGVCVCACVRLKCCSKII